MKGGITSGVVYPLAVVDLSEEFRFKSVGGTSAGAIAAAVTAAAEYRRVTTGSRDGFEQIKALPEFLGGTTTNGQSNLLNLFPPAKETRRLFAVLAAFLGDRSTWSKALRAFAALLVLSPLVTLAILAAVVVVLAFLWWMAASALCLVIVAIAFLIIGVLLLVAISARRALFTTIPENNFGFCIGRPGVTDWLHETIQKIAGRTAADPPLTFADLWLAGEAVANRDEQLRDAAEERDLRSINLQMMTTALTHGHPYRLPFEKNLFSFRESELRDYFPKPVVDWLVAHPRTSKDETPKPWSDLRPLPEQWDLPIVVAVRMSLSFPVLFSMVPLYAVDHTRKTPAYERCWFIDGGLSSNFPLSMFDSPFPRWPTFGINLGDFHPDFPKDPDERKNVWMVTTLGGGTSDHWRRFDTIAGYVGAMLDAIRNWHDNTLLAVPGFRDRVVLVKLAKDEGGLNLAMPPERVKALSMRGLYAGRKLRERFGAGGATFGALGWNGHRWARYKTSMALLQKAMRRMHNAFPAKDPIYPDYNALVARDRDENPETGRWWEHRPPAEYRALTEEFLDVAKKAAEGVDFDREAPRPKPELRITPQL